MTKISTAIFEKNLQKLQEEEKDLQEMTARIQKRLAGIREK